MRDSYIILECLQNKTGLFIEFTVYVDIIRCFHNSAPITVKLN